MVTIHLHPKNGCKPNKKSRPTRAISIQNKIFLCRVGSRAQRVIPPLGTTRWWHFLLRKRSHPTQKALDQKKYVGWVLERSEKFHHRKYSKRRDFYLRFEPDLRKKLKFLATKFQGLISSTLHAAAFSSAEVSVSKGRRGPIACAVS